jgi:hypothetical protein
MVKKRSSKDQGARSIPVSNILAFSRYFFQNYYNTKYVYAY